jgi:hypothetical protein
MAAGPSSPNPYAPPQAAYAPLPPGSQGYVVPAPRVEGALVTIAKAYPLPALCAKCATPADLRARSQTFSWFPPWTYLLALVGLLPMVIVQMVLTKRAPLAVPLCPRCNARWTMGRVLRTLSVVVPVLGGLVVAMIGAASGSSAVLIAGFLLIFPGILAVIPVELLVQRPRILRAVFIDDYYVKLAGFSPQVLDVMRRLESAR